MFITCDGQVVKILPIDPPLLSDHSFVVADCDCLLPSVESSRYRQLRDWRSLDVDAFVADLQCSELVHAAGQRPVGDQLDEELSINAHVAKVSSACYYHLRRHTVALEQKCPAVNTRATEAL